MPDGMRRMENVWGVLLEEDRLRCRLKWTGRRRGSGGVGELLRAEEAQCQIGEQKQRHGAAAIEQDIAGRAGAMGQKALVEFVRTGDKAAAEDGEDCVLEIAGLGQRKPPGAEPEEAVDAVSAEVHPLTDIEMDVPPTHIGDRAEEFLVDPAEGLAGVVRAEGIG